MADDIRPPDPDKGEAPGAVMSVTEMTPHPADESSAPGPYNDLEINRPPVSTNDPQTPIAQSLVAGAGAPSPPAPEVPEPEATPLEAETEVKTTKKGDA